MKYYFTYGSSGHPFIGGWTIVHATNITNACNAFKRRHPDKGDEMDCAFVYTEAQFDKTGMRKNGNFGAFLNEVIYDI